MTPEDFYKRQNIEKQLFNGAVNHFGIKKPGSESLKSYPYTLQLGETLMDLAEVLFPNQPDMWTVLFDVNKTKHVDDWKAGDTIMIPEQLAVQTYATPVVTPQSETSPWPVRSASVEVQEAQTCEPVTSLVLSATADELTAEWAFNPNATHYLFEYRKVGDATWSTPEIVFTTSKTITGVTDNTEYEFRVWCVCRFGGVSSKVTDTITTGEYPACAVLTEVVILEVKDTSMKLELVDPTPGDPTFKYGLSYYEVNNPSVVTEVDSDTNVFELVNLVAGSIYAFKGRRECRYLNENYFGEWTAEKTQNMFPACGIVQNIFVQNRNANEFTVLWERNINAINQIINIRKLGSDTVLQTFNSMANQLTVEQLTPDTDYEIEFITECAGGLQSAPKIHSVRTTAALCPLPEFVVVEEKEGVNEEGNPLSRHISIRVQAHAVVQQYIYLINNAVVATVNNNTLEALVPDPNWTLTSVQVGIRYRCGSDSLTAIVNKVLELTRPNPSVLVCLAPTVAVENVQQTTVDFIVGIADDNTTSFELQYRPDYANEISGWTTVAVVAGKNTITELPAGKRILWKLKAVCTIEEETVDSSWKQGEFTMEAADVEEGACPAVVFLQVDGVKENEARATWQQPVEGTNITGYKVRLTNSITQTVVATVDKLNSEFDHTFGSLTPGETYYVELQSVCGDNLSEWSGAIEFTTTNIGEGGGGGGDV